MNRLNLNKDPEAVFIALVKMEGVRWAANQDHHIENGFIFVLNKLRRSIRDDDINIDEFEREIYGHAGYNRYKVFGSGEISLVYEDRPALKKYRLLMRSQELGFLTEGPLKIPLCEVCEKSVWSSSVDCSEDHEYLQSLVLKAEGDTQG